MVLKEIEGFETTLSDISSPCLAIVFQRALWGWALWWFHGSMAPEAKAMFFYVKKNTWKMNQGPGSSSK